eukprot:9497943-Pyramimonas_sp.AAC.1
MRAHPRETWWREKDCRCELPRDKREGPVPVQATRAMPSVAHEPEAPGETFRKSANTATADDNDGGDEHDDDGGGNDDKNGDDGDGDGD